MDFIGFLIYAIVILVVLSRITSLKKFLPRGVEFSEIGATIDRVSMISKRIAIPIVILIIGIFVLLKSLVIIPAGATGVYELFGKVSDRQLPSGIHLVNPLGRVTKMSVRTEEYTMSVVAEEGQRYGDDSILALTNEGLEVSLDLTVLYRLEEASAATVYRTLGPNYVEKVIRPQIRSIIRSETSRYSAKEIYAEKREEFSSSISEKLTEELVTRGIALEEVLLRNVALPDKLAQSIQDKLTAEQESQRYDFVLDKEAKEAERKRIEAAGQRDSQKIVNESLTDKYLEYLYINSLKDRQGTIYVPTNPDNGMPLFKSIP